MAGVSTRAPSTTGSRSREPSPTGIMSRPIRTNTAGPTVARAVAAAAATVGFLTRPATAADA